MLKSILIISSDFTGHGHKSITESLCELFSLKDAVKVHVVDGFSLGGSPLLKIGKSYGPITRNAKDLWKLVWDISCSKPSLINEIIEFTIKENFLNLLNSIKPNIILSVHPNFNGAVLNILEKNQINIPFVTLIADLVSISPLWADCRADYIISPTVEAKNKCIEFGIPESKIKVLGFPVRSKFTKDNIHPISKVDYNLAFPLKCLLMSGGEGVGNMNKVAEILLDNFNCTVKIVAGRNLSLRKKLEQSLGKKYGHRVSIYSFMENIQELMLTSDIVFTRGSPNVMMEAISCVIPLVIIGALPGQEEGNPEYIERNNLGVVCNNINCLKEVMSDLLTNKSYKLNLIKTAQKNYSNSSIANAIVDFILDIKTREYEFSIPINTQKYSIYSILNGEQIWYNHLEMPNIIKVYRVSKFKI